MDVPEKALIDVLQKIVSAHNRRTAVYLHGQFEDRRAADDGLDSAIDTARQLIKDR